MTHQRKIRVLWVCAGLLAILLALYGFWFIESRSLPPPVLPPAGNRLAAQAPFTFAVIGDNRGNMQVFENVLRSIRRRKPQFILHTGDLVRTCTPEDYGFLLHELAKENLPFPLCAVPGNHDIGKGASERQNYELYVRAFGPRHYWFSCGDSLFVAADNAQNRPEAIEKELAWLKGVLETHRRRYKTCFVFLHIPPRDPRGIPDEEHGMVVGGQALMSILAHHQVSAVFAGHIHSFVEDRMASVPIYITGGAGAPLRPPLRKHHYLLCTVLPNGQFQVHREDVDECLDTDFPEYLLWKTHPLVALSLAGAILGAAVVFLAMRHRHHR